MSSKTKVILLLAGLTLTALAGFALKSFRSGNVPRMAASAVWGA